MIVDDPSLTEGRLDFELLRRTGTRKTHQRIIKGETSKTNIRACNFGDSQGNQDFNYLVCVLDTESGQGTVYDAERFITHRTVKVLETKEAEQAALAASVEASRSSTPAPATDYRAAKALLGETFGTKKVKQALHSQEKNQINLAQLESSSASFINRNLDKCIDRLQEAALSNDSVAEGSGSNAASIDAANLLPPFDDKTTRVEMIYQIKDVIANDAYYAVPVEDFGPDSSEDWEVLQKRYGMSDYVLDRIRNAADMEDAGHRLRCLLYLHYLLKMRELKEGALNSEAALQKAMPGANPVLVNQLLELFTEPITIANGQVRRKMSSLCKDRLTTYICILVLLLEPGYRANLTVVSTLLHIAITRMTDHFKAVGCVIEKPGKDEPQNYTAPGQTRSLQIRYACLKAPLTFPKPKRGPMK